jgi:hypothetical protein
METHTRVKWHLGKHVADKICEPCTQSYRNSEGTGSGKDGFRECLPQCSDTISLCIDPVTKSLSAD